MVELAIPCVQLDRLYLRWAIGKDLKETKKEMRLPEWKVRLAYRIFERAGLPKFNRKFDLPWKKCKKSGSRWFGGLAPYELALLIEDLHQEIRRVATNVYEKTNGDWEKFVKHLNRIPPSWLIASKKQIVITKSIIGRFLPEKWKLTDVTIYLGWEAAVVNVKGKSQRALRLPKDEFLKRYIGRDFAKS